MKSLELFDSYYKDIVEGKEPHYLTPSENLVRSLVYGNLLDGSGKRAIDFGCGEGKNSELIHKLNYHVYAYDFSKNAILATYRREFTIDASVIKAPEEIVNDADLIIAWEILHWLPHFGFEKVMTTLKNNLKCGGHLIFTMPTVNHHLFKHANHISGTRYLIDDSSPYVGCEVELLHEMEIYRILKDLGFEIKQHLEYAFIDHKSEHTPFWMHAFTVGK